ncbi:mediator of RNA polymerase II transcription subunit 15-like [Pieris brassicae]|nr:mediator of RNA polymerase II transcription subunit 15-like [Pieris brassicae]
MRLYALLALCVYARAATISLPDRKIDDLDNVDLDNLVSEPELVDQANTVKDIDNSLRNAIPVKVIQDVKKIDENSNDYIPEGDSFDVKRAPIDLKNPGSPQRQEHETQNPESYSDAQKAVFAIKQTIEDTQEVFTLGLKGISENFNNLFANNEKLSTIQQNIINLKSAFNEQVLKLNNTIKSYINPEKVEEADSEVKAVETRLRVLESNFESGVHTLSEGVELLAIMKEEDEAAKAEADAAGNPQPPSATQAPVPQNNNPVMQFLYNFQQGMANSIANLNNAVQGVFNPNANQGQPQQSSSPQGGNFVGGLFQGIQLPFGQQQQGQQNAQAAQGQEKPPGTSADEPAQTGWRPPNIIQQVQNQWNNLVNGGQNPQQAQQQPNQNPFGQAIQGIVSIFSRPNGNQNQQSTPQPSNQATANSAGSADKPSADVPQGVNVVPVDPVPQQPQPAVPIAQPQAAQAVQTAAVQPGPIQQLVQNNPIIKGLQTVATRITKPDRPRESINKNADSKGHGGWGGGAGNAGDNPNGSRIKEESEKNEEDKISEEISPEPAKTE